MAAEIIFLRTYAKLWIAAVAACLATLVLAALILPQSFRLTALSDLIQCLLLFSGTVVFIPHAVRSRGRLRLFWVLLAAGIGFWFVSRERRAAGRPPSPLEGEGGGRSPPDEGNRAKARWLRGLKRRA